MAKMSSPNIEYIRRINVVLDYIEDNLDQDLSLDVLASIAHYSSFHFHRVFSTVVGQRLNQYVGRKRLERIAAILVTNTEPVMKELAYTYGFNSESSFSRAFKKYYGVSPTRFVSEGEEILSKIGIDLFSTEKYICSIENIRKWIDMNAQITISEQEELNLVGISAIGQFEKMSVLYQQLMEWGSKHEMLPTDDFKAITIYHDNPNVTELSQVRYSACITVNQTVDPMGAIRPLVIPKGVYAIGRFEIGVDEIAQAWKAMCVWVLDCGYTFRDGQFFEIYNNDHTSHPEQKMILDIGIPLELTDHIQLDTTIDTTMLQSKCDEDGHETILGYHDFIGYMKELKVFFQKEYDGLLLLGNVYKGNVEYSYLSLTTAELKKQQLKFVIVLDHRLARFSICLSGQNKKVRRKYWQMFKDSDWTVHPLVASIEDSLFIMAHVIVNHADFDDRIGLTEQIEKGALEFIDELREVLE